MDIVAVDIGGTHARFAIAQVDEGGVRLGPETVLRTGDYPDLASAWRDYANIAGRPLPRFGGIAVAAPILGDTIRMTNNRWVVSQSELSRELGLDRFSLINDFAAVAHAVAAADDAQLKHLCGPERPLPREGVVSVVGPGTGLGVAILVRHLSGDRVIATEGGHIGFAPADEVEDRILARLRERHGRVSVERVIAGAGLAAIHAALANSEEKIDERALWQAALDGANERASQALDRFCAMLGSAAGDLALAHGAQAVVIGGGLGLRLAGRLQQSGFAARFRAKGRYEAMMAGMPVKLITHPQPGLLGAAAAFAAMGSE